MMALCITACSGDDKFVEPEPIPTPTPSPEQEDDPFAKERAALIDLYNATNGAQWTHHDNWGSDKPLSEWYGIKLDDEGHVLTLDLNENNLCGSIPKSIGDLSYVTKISVYDNQLEETLPESIGYLTNLEFFYVDGNRLTGSIPSWLVNLPLLRAVYMGNNQLTGEIPDNIGNLTKLQQLHLEKNQLTGEIPNSLAKLTELKYLSLNNNRLSGSIPEFLGELMNLVRILLNDNQLTGEIPSSLGVLNSLDALRLDNNQLTGEIPSSLGNLTSLQTLTLNDNQLKGEIPSSLGNLTSLKYLDISNNNLISGEIPSSLGALNSLGTLILNNNQLTGEIPSSLGALNSLGTLRLDNNQLIGEIPSSLGNLASLQTLTLNDNQLKGGIPSSLGNLTSLTFLNISDNNQISGEIPSSLGNLTSLEVFYLTNNQLTGEIPSSLGNLTKLKDLSLRANMLTGTIPDSFVNLTALRLLDITQNRMDGVLSEALLKSDWWASRTIDLLQQDGYRLNYGWLYESTDFSKDGLVEQLQHHTKGNGITLAITGDAFSDRLVNDGTFHDLAVKAMDHFFSKEPYTSFREYFDVYMVNAISKNEILEENTVFEAKMVNQAYHLDNIETVLYYLYKISELNNSNSNVTTLVILNTKNGGRPGCYLFNQGFSVGMCRTAESDMQAEVVHETGGHGFGLLGDEYSYDNIEGKTFTDKDYLDKLHSDGYYLNLDYESDPQKVLWKDFINNPDYEVENIGVYEGGLSSYTYGIYRSTYESVMSSASNYQNYNAPSRWAIYQRIMKLSGVSYTFDDFLQYDKINLERFAQQASTRNYVERSDANMGYRGAPPVFLNYPSSEIGKQHKNSR